MKPRNASGDINGEGDGYLVMKKMYNYSKRPLMPIRPYVRKVASISSSVKEGLDE